jgi:predicted RNA binding protein YcfA (HicA-like mRNA interferase family)
MAPLWVYKAREIEQKLKTLGFECVRQKGSHRQYKHPDGRMTTVPVHRGCDVSPILCRKIASDIGLSSQEFAQI